MYPNFSLMVFLVTFNIENMIVSLSRCDLNVEKGWKIKNRPLSNVRVCDVVVKLRSMAALYESYPSYP